MMIPAFHFDPLLAKEEQSSKIQRHNVADSFRQASHQRFYSKKKQKKTKHPSLPHTSLCTGPYKLHEEYSAYQRANFGVCLLSFEAAKRQGVCPAAQRGHFHLNRGPWVPSGVTLATVKTIVPAVTVCV